MNQSMQETLALAVKMETDAITFYTKAAEQTKSPSGKLMFQSMAKDERLHLTVLNQLAQEMFGADLLRLLVGDPLTRIKTVFEVNQDSMSRRVASNPDDIGALKLALKMEDEGYKLYLALAEAAEDKEERHLFQRLAMEESKHYGLLDEALTFLGDTGNWFIYSEHSTMDGG